MAKTRALTSHLVPNSKLNVTRLRVSSSRKAVPRKKKFN